MKATGDSPLLFAEAVPPRLISVVGAKKEREYDGKFREYEEAVV
jgi:hypothetical protein